MQFLLKSEGHYLCTGGYNNLQNGLARGLKKGGINKKVGQVDFHELIELVDLARKSKIDEIKHLIKQEGYIAIQ